MTGNQSAFSFARDPEAAFWAFHRANPHVYDWLKREALRLRRNGRDHYSARTLVHAFRHHTAMTTSGETFKINDHTSPFYARLLMREEWELGEFFKTRRAVAD